MDYLSFEKPIEELETQLSKALELADETGVDMAKTITDIQQKLDEAKKKIYSIHFIRVFIECSVITNNSVNMNAHNT